MDLIERIILLLMARSICSLKAQNVAESLDLNPSNASETPSPTETYIESTITNVFSNLDQILKLIFDIPSMSLHPEVKSEPRTSVKDSKREFAAGKSESFDKAFENTLRSDFEYGQVEASKDIKVPEELSYGGLSPVDSLRRGPIQSRTADGVGLDGFSYVVIVGNRSDRAMIQTGVALSNNLVLTSSLPQKYQQEPSQLYISFRSPNWTQEAELPVMRVEPIPGEDLTLLHLIGERSLHDRTYPSLAGAEEHVIPENCSVVGWDVAGKATESAFLRKDHLLISIPQLCKDNLSHFNESRSFCSLSDMFRRPKLVGSALICSGRLFGLTPRNELKDRFTRISPYENFLQESIKSSDLMEEQHSLFGFWNSGETRQQNSEISSVALIPLIFVISRQLFL